MAGWRENAGGTAEIVLASDLPCLPEKGWRPDFPRSM